MHSVLIIFFLTLTSVLAIELHQNIITSNNKFASDLHQELAKYGNENFVVSPLSAESVLALAQSGARGPTKQELRAGLHLPNNQNLIENSFRSLKSILKTKNSSDKSNKRYNFHLANKLYLHESFSIKPKFSQIATEVFDCELEKINFAQNTQAAKIINDWVKIKTENKIQDLISSDNIDSNTRAIIINALYFNGNWSSIFKRFLTRKNDFHTQDRSIIQTETMFKSEEDMTFNYAENLKLQAQFLELPFQGYKASMVFVLPFEKLGINNLERQIEEVLAPQSWSLEFVNMSIPKFKIDSKIDIKAILQNLGVSKPFLLGEADFGGISDNNVVISDVIQKTFIDVHESGVEAASATFAGFTLLSIQSTPEFKQFIVDHPFIFYIKIKDLVVFLGRVGKPSY